MKIVYASKVENCTSPTTTTQIRWWEFDGKISSLLILIRGKPLPRAILEASLLAHKRNVFNEAIIGQVNVLPFVVMH